MEEEKPEGMRVRGAMPKQQKFLLIGDEVEVRQVEEGLRGSWQTGHVIEVSENARVVRYNHFVEEDGITNCLERIAVSGTVDGASSPGRVPSAYAACGHRGRIRPSLPPDVGRPVKDFWYGLCVDAWYEEGWWEGVVFDNKVGSGERSVFFPDEGDELTFNIGTLRLTRDWDEASGTWAARGTWAFLALVNELTDGTAGSTPLWIKQLWYNLRTMDGFLRGISEWTLGKQSLWRMLMKRAISQHRLVDFNNNVNKNVVAVVSTGEEKLPRTRRVSRRRKRPFSAGNVQEQHGRNCFYVGNVEQQLVTVEVHERGEEKQTPVGGVVSFREQEEQEARSCVQPSPAFKKKNEVLDQEDGRQTIAEYIRLVDEKTKSKAAVTKQLLDRVRLEAKMYLLTKGWVFEHEQRCSGRWELHYFSPEGKRFYSFYSACSALQREEKPCLEKAKYQLVYEKGLRGSSVQSSPSATAVFTGRECRVVPSPVKRCASHKEGTEACAPPAAIDSAKLKSVVYCSSIKKQKVSISKDQRIQLCRVVPSPPAAIVSADLKSIVSCSPIKKGKASISDNKRDEYQRNGLCKNRDPTIIKSHEFRTQADSGVSAATLLATAEDIQQVCFRSCPVSAEKPSNERLISVGSHGERRLVQWKRKRGRPPKVLKVEIYSECNGFSSGTCSRWKVKGRQYQSDSICSICHYGGLLILCDQCPSSFHLDCVYLKEPPKGKWFCPCCRCSICGSSDFNDGNGEYSELAVLYCDQCEREYHVGCWSKRERQMLESFPIGNWFCSRGCSKIFEHLHKILGKPNATPVNGLTWTVLRSDLNRLNFRGFYTMLLEKGNKLISVAVIRIHGEKVAEMPLVGTRVKYRRRGMCHLLMSELENMLSALGVERLILPAAPQLKDTWIRSFGFMELTSEEKFELLGFTFLDFQDTNMCQKLLRPVIKKNPQGVTPESFFHATKAHWQAETGDRALHPAGAYSVEATENCFQRKIPDESLMLTGGTNLYAYSSSSFEAPQEVSTDLGRRLVDLYDKHHTDANANRTMNLPKGWGSDFFQHIYTRRCKRIVDESIKRIKQTALLCTIPHPHG